MVDTGETDPNNPDTDGDGTPDGQDLADSDNDGLPDTYEDRDRDSVRDPDETDPNNPDTDGDGWVDGPRNTRLNIVLYRIRCDNEEEDIGADELFPVNDEIRSPVDTSSLDGDFSMEGGDEIFPMMVIGRRNTAPGLPTDFVWRLELWEEDFFDWTDDHWQTQDKTFSAAAGIVSHRYLTDAWYDTTDYTVEYWIQATRFADPNPLDPNADSDRDGLTEREEYDICRGIGAAGASLGGDFRGEADPRWRDLFMELDITSSGQDPESYSKIDLVSQMYYHDLTVHLADRGSRYEGAQVLAVGGSVHYAPPGTPNIQGLAADSANFNPARRGRFHYVIAADQVNDTIVNLGRADKPKKDDAGNAVCSRAGWRYVFKSDFFDHISDLESIVFLHELGHNLALCHRPGDGGTGGNVDRPPTLITGCEKFKDANGNGVGEPDENINGNCTHYWIGEDSDTAMGAGFSFNWTGAGTGAVLGAGTGAVLGGILGGPLGSGIGILVGAGVGAIVGGLGDLWDAIDREINYDDAEWRVLDLTGVSP